MSNNEDSVQRTCTVIDSYAEWTPAFSAGNLLKFRWTVLKYSPYKPDILPYDFLIWPTEKKYRRFAVFTWTAKSWTMLKTGSGDL